MLGAVPLVIATGPGSELRRPLGITIVGGLMVSQMLTLYTTPVIYLLLDRLHRRLGGGSAEHAPAYHARRAAAACALRYRRSDITTYDLSAALKALRLAGSYEARIIILQRL